jgi:tetratricopeptide (TPR) repeat protein
MRNIFGGIVLLLISVSTFSQFSADSLLHVVRTSRSDSFRITAAMDLVCSFGYSQQDSVFQYAEQLINAGQENKFPPAVALGFISVSYALFRQDNKAAALENSIKALKIAEKYRNERCLAMVYNGLGLCYSNDDPRSNMYRHMGLDVLKEKGDSKEKVLLFINLGRAFEDMGKMDSALYYESEAFEMVLRMKEAPDKSFVRSAMVWSLTSMGNSYRNLGQPELSSTYHREALKIALQYKYPYPIIAAYQGLVQHFNATGNRDSAVHYYKLLLQSAQQEGPGYQISPSQYLYNHYNKLKDQDSAYKYLQLYANALVQQDSSMKTSKMMTLSFEEESRQKELLLQRQTIAHERKLNLQYAAIAIALIVFIIIYLFLSRSIIVKTRFVQFFSILGLLAVFEFVNLLIHPYLAEFTHHSPILMLLALIGIGALLIPIHHKLEKKLTQLMVEKNKSIRLAAAKKTIARLEGGST